MKLVIGPSFVSASVRVSVSVRNVNQKPGIRNYLSPKNSWAVRMWSSILTWGVVRNRSIAFSH